MDERNRLQKPPNYIAVSVSIGTLTGSGLFEIQPNLVEPDSTRPDICVDIDELLARERFSNRANSSYHAGASPVMIHERAALLADLEPVPGYSSTRSPFVKTQTASAAVSI